MTDKNGRILVVLLNYKTAQMTADAMQATRRAMRDLDGDILVVDNDSGDGSFEVLSTAIAQIDQTDNLAKCSVIQSGYNGGYGYGNNVGIRYGLEDGGYEYIYIQNSDAFPNEASIRKLLEFLTDTPTAGFAGSHLHGEDGHPHFTQFRFPSLASEFEGAAHIGPITRLLKRFQVPLFGLSDEHPTQVDWIAGASIMIRTQVFEEIGLFDENFFLYFEEVDLCRRARKKGWTTHYVPQSRVVHLGSVSTGMGSWSHIPQYWLNSRMYYYEKHFGRTYAVLATFLLLAGGALARFRHLVGGPRPRDPKGFQRDLIVHFLRNIWRPRDALSPHVKRISL